MCFSKTKEQILVAIFALEIGCRSGFGGFSVFRDKVFWLVDVKMLNLKTEKENLEQQDSRIVKT